MEGTAAERSKARKHLQALRIARENYQELLEEAILPCGKDEETLAEFVTELKAMFVPLKRDLQYMQDALYKRTHSGAEPPENYESEADRQLRTAAEENAKALSKLQTIIGRLQNETKGRLTLSVGNQERVITGNYETFRLTAEAIEEPLKDLLGITIHFAKGEASAVGIEWKAKLQTEALYREENQLPREEGIL